MSIESSDRSPQANCLPEDKPVPRPEDFIGTIIGSSHRVESIEAVGSKFVVFTLRNLKTGEIDQVMKVLRGEFDPKAPLLEALPVAMQDLSRNPGRVVRICDRLLSIDPANEAAAFNKGVALLETKELSAALEAFDLAVALQPKDALNLVHRAACLAMLQRDNESLRDLRAGAAADTGQLKTALTMVPPHAAVIRQALARLAMTAASREEARRALRTYFGLAMKLRRLFFRFFS